MNGLGLTEMLARAARPTVERRPPQPLDRGDVAVAVEDDRITEPGGSDDAEELGPVETEVQDLAPDRLDAGDAVAVEVFKEIDAGPRQS